MSAKSTSPERDTLSRTSSSSSSSHHLSSAGSPETANLKSKSADAGCNNTNADKANISSPPFSSWRASIQQIQRNPNNHNFQSLAKMSMPQNEGNPDNPTPPLLSPDFSIPSNVKPAQPATNLTTGSAVMSRSLDSQRSTTSSTAGSDHGESTFDGVTDSTTAERSSVSIANSTSSAGYSEEKMSEDPQSLVNGLGLQPPSNITSAPQASSKTFQLGSRQPRNKIPGSRRMSGVNSGTGTASPNSEKSNQASDSLGVIGICALDAKARSKPARNILNRINSRSQFEVLIFGDKIILDEAAENWPVCNYLISFFSEGFPLDKAIEYVRLRKPFSVNDLPMQTVLWDRRICLRILDRFQVRTPKRLEVIRDGGPKAHTPEIGQHIFERTGVRILNQDDPPEKGIPPPKSVVMIDSDTLSVDGKHLKKPFVEKPVSGEDHNIHIYFAGGGGRRLFRKINNKSSEADESLNEPRCITDMENSYIYESFLDTENHEDVKAYTVGPEFCHAETRKSPVVDGIVKRNTHGKEVRYVTSLTEEEATMASRISEAFGQRVCGFDLLRVDDKSYVIDVNGWSFVKDNTEYYDRCANILKELFVREKMRKDGKAAAVDGEGLENGLPTRPTGHHFNTLKSILRSPSMSRLAGGFHPHSKTHEPSSSPDMSAQTVPFSASNSLEKPMEATRGSKIPALQPDSSIPSPTASAQLTSQFASPPPTTSAPPLALPATAEQEQKTPVPPPASKSQWKLKGMVAVIRHADRTPKQKFKFTFHTKPFVDLLKGHREEVILTGETALNSVQEAAKLALQEGIEDPQKLKNLQIIIAKKGSFTGTKVQIKPMFRKTPSHDSPVQAPVEASPIIKTFTGRESLGSSDDRLSKAQTRKDSLSGVTLSRATAADDNLEIEKLQLIVKWGGEPTHSARYQSQELAENMRNDLLLLNRDALHDLKVFSSSERRVTTSAQIWTAAFLNVKDIPPNYVEIRKDLLDDSNAAKDEMDKVKKKLKGLLRKGNKAPAQFAWPENMPEPYLVARNVVELMTFHRKVMRQNFARLDGTAQSALSSASKTTEANLANESNIGNVSIKDIQPRWCSGEDAALFKERWEKLFDEFCDPEKVDPGKISELHDTIKFDALHNRPFLEWIFTPSAAVLEEFYPSESRSRAPTVNSDDNPQAQESTSKQSARSESRGSIAATDKGEKTGLAQRIGFRKRTSVVDPNALKAAASDASTQSYFSLYAGDEISKSKADVRLAKLRELFMYSKILFDFIGPQEYGITDSEKLEIGLLTSLPLLRAIVNDLEDVQASEGAKTRVYFTKESHIYTLLNCIIEGGIKTKIERNKIPELDYLSTICFELYESQNHTEDHEDDSFNYSIRMSISPGCHTFEPLDVQLDSKHCIGFAQRRSLTAHRDYDQVIATLRDKFHTVKLPKSFVAINLSEKTPQTSEEQSEDGLLPEGKADLSPEHNAQSEEDEYKKPGIDALKIVQGEVSVEQ